MVNNDGWYTWNSWNRFLSFRELKYFVSAILFTKSVPTVPKSSNYTLTCLHKLLHGGCV